MSEMRSPRPRLAYATVGLHGSKRYSLGRVEILLGTSRKPVCMREVDPSSNGKAGTRADYVYKAAAKPAQKRESLT